MSFIKAFHVLSALNKDTLLITATPQLVTEWKRRLLLDANKEVIATPPILFWDEWLKKLLEQDPQSPIPLSKLQAQLLWEKVIRDDLRASEYNRSLSLKGLALRASEAYTYMQAYKINLTELAFNGEESDALTRWIKAIKLELKNEQFQQRALAADLTSLINPAIQNLTLPKSIILDGFETFTSAQQALLAQLKEKNCEILTVQSDLEPATPTVTACLDESSELHQLVSRIQDLISQTPTLRIAILTSNSFSDIDSLRRELDSALIPETCTNPFYEQQAVTMQGRPLSDWPMIQQTLHLLSLAGKKSIAFSDFSTLLFSPWLKGFEKEKMGRASLDAMFRRQNRHHISLKHLLTSIDVETLPALHSIIKTLESWATPARSVSQWVKEVHTLLQSTGIVQTGFDDEVVRSNIEIRQVNSFKDVLTSLVSADAIHASMNWTQFLSLLHATCSETQMIRIAKHPNITVMPLAQIAGLAFDHVFVLAMDEQAFPPAAHPQPLLPIALQKKYRIPMSHGSLQFESSQWLWQQLLWASPNIEISYAKQKTEQEMKPSAFLKDLVIRTANEKINHQQAAELETYDDSTNIPLFADEKIRGGTAIIRNQSACPFRAFVAHRLSVSALGDTEPGIEPSTKGSLIHVALEFIWHQLKSQSALLALNEQERDKLIQAAIEHAWQKNRSSHNFSVQQFEKKRMFRLLTEWLQLECMRPAFQVIETEKEFSLQLPEHSAQQLPLRINADRIDQDATGRKILIDYKTGAKQSVSKWLGERIEEPQLPLYALASGLTEHDAVTFATVRSGHEMGFEGLSGEETEIDGVAVCDGKRNRPENWQRLLDEWKTSLDMLAEEFINGRSDVSPRNKAACTYCGMEALCRIEETGFDMENRSES